MKKISLALERTLHGEPQGEGLLGSLQDLAPGRAGGARAPGQIQYTRTRSVGIAPQVLERHRVTAVTNDPTADAFRLLRTQVLMQMRANNWRTLAVTSPNKGAGKSTLSLNLAIGFAMELDYTALLVDADLRDPDLHRMLGLAEGRGLVDYLLGRAAIEDLLLHPRLGNLVVLSGGAPVENSSELMRSPMMADMIHELRDRYADRLIVFDVPPVLAGADTLALSAYMDATILLVEERRTAREDIERACDLLRGSNVMGIVLNKSRELPRPEPIRWPEPGLLRRFFGVRR